MRFMPPIQTPETPDFDKNEIKKEDFKNSRIQKYTEKYDPRSPQNIKRRKEQRAAYIKAHRFDVMNLTVAVIALLVSVASLVVAVIALEFA